MRATNIFLLTVLAALLLLGTTGCVVYDPYLYPDYGYAYPEYSPPPAVGVAPFFGLYAPWGISGYYGAPYGYYGGHGYYGHGGYYRGPYGYYGGHGGYYHGSYGYYGGHGGSGGHGGGNNHGGGGGHGSHH